MLNLLLSEFCRNNFWLTLIISTMAIFFCERFLRRRGLFVHWQGRMAGLILLTTPHSFLYSWMKLMLMHPLIAVQGSQYFVWFLRGYGSNVINKPPHTNLTREQQLLLGILSFLTVMTIFELIDQSFYNPKTIYFICGIPLKISQLLFWLTGCIWGAIICEGALTYSSFTLPHFNWIYAARVQQLVLFNSLLWGNQLCNFINNHLHPNIILICVGLCALTALWEMGYELCQYLCLKNS